jgi:hypothetical protein
MQPMPQRIEAGYFSDIKIRSCRAIRTFHTRATNDRRAQRGATMMLSRFDREIQIPVSARSIASPATTMKR